MAIEIHNETQEPITESVFAALANHVLNAMFVHPDTDVSIMFVDEQSMEQLHEQWMGEPGPTDVLSFPMDELRPGRQDAVAPAGLLGDVVICPDVARVQALAAGHDVTREMQVLLTHGMLHLLGFDHATPLEEAQMFGLQNELLTAFDKDGKNL